jgi:PTS system mannitol-specific IIA component
MGDNRRQLLTASGVRLNQSAEGYPDAIKQVGAVLVALGAVEHAYVESMLEREQSISTYIGEGVAIPHGTAAGKGAVIRDALAVVQFPEGVDWHGDDVRLCIGIAAVGDRHIGILAQLAELLVYEDRGASLRTASTAEEVVAVLAPDKQRDDHSREFEEPDRTHNGGPR